MPAGEAHTPKPFPPEGFDFFNVLTQNYRVTDGPTVNVVGTKDE
jgi:hypothetical protein